MNNEQKLIVELFNQNVRGKRNNASGNKKHDGSAGHWLEQQMGIKANGNNAPDLYGYEMKNHTSSGKTTFGDWSADLSIWGKKRPNPSIHRLNRDTEFLKYFGAPNIHKNGRLSWAGTISPKIGRYNLCGQRLDVTKNNDIQALYSFSHDQRKDKYLLIPHMLQTDLVLAQWSQSKLKKNLEEKFNNKGWFKCFQNKEGVYDRISFGSPINYDEWIKQVRQGVVYFDSGMYAGNSRPYAQWRANNNYWDSLITESY